MLAALVAAALAADLTASAEAAPDVGDDDEPRWEEPSAPRLRVGAWGGTIYDVKAQDALPFAGGQLAWSFDRFDVGVLAQAYRFGRERASSDWGPVVLARFDQRFETRRGLEAAIGFGVGAGRERSWTAWFQFGAGFRVTQGPVFVGGEFGFEQDRFFRLGATLGLAVF